MCARTMHSHVRGRTPMCPVRDAKQHGRAIARKRDPSTELSFRRSEAKACLSEVEWVEEPASLQAPPITPVIPQRSGGICM